jgi:hypothetical protein
MWTVCHRYLCKKFEIMILNSLGRIWRHSHGANLAQTGEEDIELGSVLYCSLPRKVSI